MCVLVQRLSPAASCCHISRKAQLLRRERPDDMAQALTTSIKHEHGHAHSHRIWPARLRTHNGYAVLLRPSTQVLCLRGVPTTPDNVKVGLSLLYVGQARPLLRRSLGQQLPLVVHEHKSLKVRWDPRQLEGDSRSGLHMCDIRRRVLTTAFCARRP
jgi:hypothetical protein